MNIALTLIGLHDKQIGHMTGNVVLITRGITAEHLLQTKSTVSNHQSQIQTRTRQHTCENWQEHDHSSGA